MATIHGDAWSVRSTSRSTVLKMYQDFEALISPQWSSLYHLFWVTMVLVIVQCLTYVFTSLRFTWVMRSNRVGRDLPTLPYSVPIFGHAFGFLRNTGGLVASLKTQLNNGMPISLKLPHTAIYLVSDPGNISTIYKNEGVILPASQGHAIILRNVFAVSKPAVEAYKADNSGLGNRPNSWSIVEPHNRIYHLMFKSATKSMSGDGLQRWMARFMENFASRLGDREIGSEWTEMPDLFAFVRCPMFCAGVDSLCGPHLLSLSPAFAQDFWKFDHDVAYLLKGYPRWLSPRSWAARDKCIQAVKIWHTFARQHYTEEERDPSDHYEQYFGDVFMRTRQHHHSKMSSVRTEDMASTDLGIIWAMNANTVLNVLWGIVEIMKDSQLLDRVRAEIAAAILPSSTATHVQFNVSKLCSQPLVQSIYAENLRLRVTLFQMRGVQGDDFRLGDWVLRRNNLIIVPSHNAHMNSNVWNTGTESDPHPLDTFWADRFLKSPNGQFTGPLKQNSKCCHNRKIAQSINDKTTTISSIEANTPRFNSDDLGGAFIPYGGGQRICPGRHFAKQEIIICFATFVTTFDFEFVTTKAWKCEPDLQRYGTGTLPPKGQIAFKVRRRYGSED